MPPLFHLSFERATLLLTIPEMISSSPPTKL